MPLDIPESREETRLRRIFAITGTAAFLVLAPGTVAGIVPWWISGWKVHAPFPGSTLLQLIGILLITSGIPVVVECFARFALQGIGTPAPVFPTQRLVIAGSYRFVRNPMYVAVFMILLGEAAFLGNTGILVFALCAWLIAHLFVIHYEEPTLYRTYGPQYEAYLAHVPRWIPRLQPWHGGQTRTQSQQAVGESSHGSVDSPRNRRYR